MQRQTCLITNGVCSCCNDTPLPKMHKKHGKFCTAFLSGFICPLHSREEMIAHKLLDHIHLGVLCSVPLTETI